MSEGTSVANEGIGAVPASTIASATMVSAPTSAPNAAPVSVPISVPISVNVENLTVAFNQRQVLHGLNLAFPSRQISVLVGRSGSGKTTLLRAINRLNEEFPHAQTTGQVWVDVGQGLEPVYPHAARTARPLPDLRQRVGMVFQSPHVLPSTIFANVALPLRLVAQCTEAQIAQRVPAALQAVGLWDEVADRLHSPALRLSGGQQQRLCLARTLALQPAILLLDEPTASLDVQATRDIEALLTRLARDYTLIVVSHSPAQAARLARHLVVLEEGRVLYQSALSATGKATGSCVSYTEADILHRMYGEA